MDTNFNIESVKILSKFSREKSDLIPILQEFQQELGYLPEEIMRQVAYYLYLSPSTVYSIATFYSQFKFVPSGKKVVRACRGTACHVRGGAGVLREIEKRLCIKPGETTEDREYTLETVACIGACALAPTITVAKETYGQMTPKKVKEVFDDR
ncbi:MAG: NADH-quinone oxidoreductase subunit NuoE [Dehalococcoidales bacterium]|nr:NADH-quinone oxidoreductase subunit NuoE [Dehalococcoidales bacterium]